MKIRFAKISFILFAVILAAVSAEAQNFRRNLALTKGANIEIINNFGRVDAVAEKREGESPGELSFLTANSTSPLSDSDIKITFINFKTVIEVVPAYPKKRIDLSLNLPERTNLKIQTDAGEVRVSGDFAKVEVRTETGTIAADVPLENLAYNFVWTASRPRFLSDVELAKVREKSAGKFVLSGTANKETPKSKF